MKRASVLLLLLASTLLASSVACGGGEAPPTASPSTETVTATATAPATRPATSQGRPSEEAVTPTPVLPTATPTPGPATATPTPVPPTAAPMPVIPTPTRAVVLPTPTPMPVIPTPTPTRAVVLPTPVPPSGGFPPPYVPPPSFGPRPIESCYGSTTLPAVRGFRVTVRCTSFGYRSLFEIRVETDYFANFEYPVVIEVTVDPPFGFRGTDTDYLYYDGDSTEFVWPRDFSLTAEPVEGTYSIEVRASEGFRFPSSVVASGSFRIW